jgi:folate-binding protein YgfZ
MMWYLQPSPVVFKVTGKDARRYLNNRLSQDLRSLSAGASVVAGALNPQGRVEGLYTVYVGNEDVFYLASDGGERQPLFAALGRYIVADRVSIVDCSSEALVGHCAGTKSLELGEGVLCFTSSRRRLGEDGEDFVVISDNLGEIRAKLIERLGPPLSTAEYDLKRFAEGFAQYGSEINDSMILTEAGLRDAVSFQKGCYVGQEVIERIDAIGKLPRHLERIVFEGSEGFAPEGSVVGRDAKPIGRIVSAIPDTTNNQMRVFALLKTGAYAANDQVQCEGRTGTILSSEDTRV